MIDIEIVQFGNTYPEGRPTYFVKCGCQTFTFLTEEGVYVFVKDYMKDPEGTEQKYYAQFEKSPTEGTTEPRNERAYAAEPGLSLGQMLRR